MLDFSQFETRITSILIPQSKLSAMDYIVIHPYTKRSDPIATILGRTVDSAR